MKKLSLELAKKIIEGAEQEAKNLGVSMVVSQNLTSERYPIY
ncbi:hypothetical protein [Ammoniphilus sp. 3BR4]